jgi:hypothetical protein
MIGIKSCYRSFINWKNSIFSAPSPPRMSEICKEEYAMAHEYNDWFWDDLGK